MKFSKYLIALVIGASMQFSQASSRDTFELVGSQAGNFELGWFGEAWCDTANKWCNDTTYKDLTVDTVIKKDTTILMVYKQIVTDTIINGTDTQFVTVDSLVPDTSYSTDTTIIDSSTIVGCASSDFVKDTGGLVAGTQYLNYKYKFRDWWAQLPMVWANWAGIDAASYKKMVITYKGILPVHMAKLEFFYAAWGSYADTIKNKQKKGDGIAELASSASWVTRVITIPDSVDMVGITGLTLNITNIPGNASGVSELGTIKIHRIAIIGDQASTTYSALPKNKQKDRFLFIPKTSGKVTVSVYSLKGELLYSKPFGVEANKAYSVRQLANRFSGSSQVRLLSIKGAGVNVSEKIR